MMDMGKIGKFIAACRKNKGLTQMQLAEKLNITDRAISKWECGKTMPDSSIMIELSEILGISVNELLLGEGIEMKDFNKQAELNLVEVIRQKEDADKRLLFTEIVIGIFGVLFLVLLILVAALAKMDTWLRFTLIGLGFVIFLVACFVAISIEQKAGYYECMKCHHRYIPTYKQVLFAMHANRTRYMKCPCCGKKSWQKKVISKDEK